MRAYTIVGTLVVSFLLVGFSPTQNWSGPELPLHCVQCATQDNQISDPLHGLKKQTMSSVGVVLYDSHVPHPPAKRWKGLINLVYKHGPTLLMANTPGLTELGIPEVSRPSYVLVIRRFRDFIRGFERIYGEVTEHKLPLAHVYSVNGVSVVETYNNFSDEALIHELFHTIAKKIESELSLPNILINNHRVIDPIVSKFMVSNYYKDWVNNNY